MAVATGQQGGPGRRAQRRHVEAVVSQPAFGHPRVVRRLDRAAERARVAEAGVVDQHDQHVGRAGRRVDVVDLGPVRLGTAQSAGQGPAELRAPDRKLRAIWPAHVTPPGSGIVRHSPSPRVSTSTSSTNRASPASGSLPGGSAPSPPRRAATLPRRCGRLRSRAPSPRPRVRVRCDARPSWYTGRPHEARRGRVDRFRRNRAPARCRPCPEPSHSPCSPAQHPRTSSAPPARDDSSRSWRVSARGDPASATITARSGGAPRPPRPLLERWFIGGQWHLAVAHPRAAPSRTSPHRPTAGERVVNAFEEPRPDRTRPCHRGCHR